MHYLAETRVAPDTSFSSNIDLGKSQIIPIGENFEFHELLKSIGSSFAKEIPHKITTDFTIHDFQVMSRHPVIFGISYQGFLSVINTDSLTVSNTKISKYLKHIVKNHEETHAFITNFNKKIFVVQIPDGTVVSKVKSIIPATIDSFGYSVNGLLTTFNTSGRISLFEWDGVTVNKIRKKIDTGIEKPDKSFISNDGKTLVLSKDSKTLLFTSTGEKIYEIPNTTALSCIAPNNRDLAVASRIPDNSYEIAIVNITKPKDVLHTIKISPGESISQIHISKCNNFLIATFKTGTIKIWEMRGRKREATLPVHSQAIQKISLTSSRIFSSSTEGCLCVSQMPEFLDDTQKKFESVTKLQGSPHFFFVHESKIYKGDLINKDTVETFPSIGINRITLAKSANTLDCVFLGAMVSLKEKLVQWNTRTSECTNIIEELPGRMSSLELSADDSFMYIGTECCKILVYSTSTWTMTTQLTGHSAAITDLIYIKEGGAIVSASNDDSLRVWLANKNYKCKSLLGHRSDIVKLAYFPAMEIMISASKDCKIGIWTVVDYSLVTFLTGHSSPVSSIYPSSIGKYLYSMDVEGTIKFWSLETYDCIFDEKYPGYSTFFLSEGEKKFILKSFNNIQLSENPMNGDKIRVVGINDKHKFMKYFNNILDTRTTPIYDTSLEKGVIMPYVITPMHIYAFLNMTSHLEKSLSPGTPLLYTSTGLNALSISVNRAFKDCITLILKHLKVSIDKKPHLFTCINKEILIDLNSFDYPQLSKLYDLMLIRYSNDKLPHLIKDDVSLPIYATSHKLEIGQKDFKLTRFDGGKAVMYLTTTVKLNLESGSSDSLDFLRSLSKSKNHDIFKSEFVQRLLAYKWKTARKSMEIQAAIYVVYLGFIVNLAFLDTDSKQSRFFLIFPLLLNFILTFYEIFQMASAFELYWESSWNYIDLARSFFTFFYALEFFADISAFRRSDVLMMLCILSFLRGISYFRLFNKTRYMINLLLEVLRDMGGFLILLVYSTLAFGVLYHIVSPGNGFDENLGISYSLDLGNFSTEGYDLAEWAIFLVSSALNPIIMLNLLIAIMGDTYDRVQDNREVADNKELLKMILEAESIRYSRRKIKKEQYLHICTGDKEKSTEQLWMGKIRALKNLIKKEGAAARSANKKVEQLAKEFNNFAEENKAMKESIQQLTAISQENNRILLGNRSTSPDGKIQPKH